MDPLANLLNFDTSESEEKEVVKKGKKKKKSASSKKLLAKAAEEARVQLIKQKQELLRETKARVQAEWEANHAKAPIFENEFQERVQLMGNSMRRLSEIEEIWKEYTAERRKQEEWEQYLKCNGLPNPKSLSEINAYIYSWTEINNNSQMSYCLKKTEEVTELLKGLEEAIGDRPAHSVRDLKEIRAEVRNLLQEQIDKTTFTLFSSIETEMVPVNVTTSKFYASSPHFEMCLWAELITPIPSKKPEVRKPFKIEFDEIQMTILLPVILLDLNKVVRAMLFSYDHWSDKCRTYDCPPLPTYQSLNMYELIMSDFDLKVDIMNSRVLEEKIVKSKVASLPPEPTLSQEIMAWSSEPQRALSEEIMFREFDEEDYLGRQVKAILNEFEVNLRERTIIGTLLLLEILNQPPQSQCLRLKHCVTLRKEDRKLQPVDYYVQFPPPDVEEEEEERETEETESMPEREIKSRVPPSQEEVEKTRERLIVLNSKIDTWVLWFEVPQVAIWDPIRNYWSTEDVHDFLFDQENETISFKAGRLGLMGLHVSRHLNFPYEDWYFERDEDEGVKFYLKAAKIGLLFKIKPGKVCLEMMENAPSKGMNWILGKYYSLPELIKEMKRGGIDVFPDPDAGSYVEISTKHVVLERNIYLVWGLFSKTFRFKRSKFNQEAGRGNVVFQAQEIYKGHQVDFCLIHTTMCSCYVLDITEESEKYSSKPASGMEKCIDLYTLLNKYSTLNAKRQSDGTCTMLIQTIKEFLSRVRPIGFS